MEDPIRKKREIIGTSNHEKLVMKREEAKSLLGTTLFNRFEVLSIVGEGAMATVFKARDLSTGRMVALKKLASESQEDVKRFEQEVKLHTRLQHKNIVEAMEFLEGEDGKTFFVMEFLDGITLELYLKAEGRVVKEEDIGKILIQICEALEHAHLCGVLHRDLKPGNIFLVDEEDKFHIKVLDFGIAKPIGEAVGLTQAGTAVGSPLYMSPEQCQGKPLDVRADVYALGILAYEVISGQPPYKAQNLMTVMAAHCDPDKKPRFLKELVPDLKKVDILDSILRTAVDTAPEKRFQKIKEFKNAIQTWLTAVEQEKASGSGTRYSTVENDDESGEYDSTSSGNNFNRVVSDDYDEDEEDEFEEEELTDAQREQAARAELSSRVDQKGRMKVSIRVDGELEKPNSQKGIIIAIALAVILLIIMAGLAIMLLKG